MGKRNSDQDRLFEIAVTSMEERGFAPDFSPEVTEQVARLERSEPARSIGNRSDLTWLSIDNDDTRDIDQVTAVELDGNAIRLHVGIADVDHLVEPSTPIDRHAEHNTVTVYTPAHNFLMLPAELSTGMTSLNQGEDRVAIVFSMSIAPDGSLTEEDVSQMLIRNEHKLAYDSLSDWLENRTAALLGDEELSSEVELQYEAARRLLDYRSRSGMLHLETLEPRAVLREQKITDMTQPRRNVARQMIEDFMIAANGVATRYLEHRGMPTFRRVVREPRRWDRIASLAEERGWKLTPEPDVESLDSFLRAEKQRDPIGFPDLSLAVVKLLGSGEYVAEMPGEDGTGHFGLAVEDYSHSTAPNRRFPDLITHRLLKNALQIGDNPYSESDLRRLALHCTEMEDEAKKVERKVRKSAAAIMLEDRVGQRFRAVVSGASPKGTWVRVFAPPVEGKLVRGEKGLDVGDRLTVRLVGVNVERGFIDFAASDR